MLALALVTPLGCGDGASSTTHSLARGGSAGSTSMPVGSAGSASVVSGAGGTGQAGLSGSSGGSTTAGQSGAGASSAAGGAGSFGTAGVGGHGGASGSAGATPRAGEGGVGGQPNEMGGTPASAGASGTASGPLGVLVYSRTQAYRHDSIPDGIAALTAVAAEQGWMLTATEDPVVFTDTLANVKVVVFLSTTGDVLDDDQQAVFEAFIRAGGGFVGIHSATDTEYDWAFYGSLVGAYFREHPAIQQANVHVEDATDPTLVGIPTDWTRTDEWYAFQDNPRPNVHVLLTLDESSYDPGTSSMGGDHPITWCHEYEGGRAYYTALGHTSESYSDPLFVGLLTRAIVWASGG